MAGHKLRINKDEFQSTLSMRRATDMESITASDIEISIHALHEESDPPPREHWSDPRISIHALHEESDVP